MQSLRSTSKILKLQKIAYENFVKANECHLLTSPTFLNQISPANYRQISHLMFPKVTNHPISPPISALQVTTANLAFFGVIQIVD
jgi:hypothetical protein